MNYMTHCITHFPRRLVIPTLLLVCVILIPFMAPIITSVEPTQISIRERMAPPSWEHPLGQDEFGRDRLSRVLYGGQVSLTTAFSSSFIACIVGVLFGLIGAYFRGFFEVILGRLADIVLCFPPILLALLSVTLFGPGVGTLVAVLSVLYFPIFARISYSETQRVSAMEFVDASRALGTSSANILFKTILPNIAGPIAIQFSLTVAAAITIESGLSFLGLGVVPPAPSWGQMLRGARNLITDDALGIFVPCAALAITIFVINLFCDRLRDVLDPKGMVKKKNPLSKTLFSTNMLRKGPLEEERVASIRKLALTTNGSNGDEVNLIEDISIDLREGYCTALVGESGSGKSLTSLALMKLLPDGIEHKAGFMTIRTKSGHALSLTDANEQVMENIRGNEISMIFQNPMTALNPVHKVGKQMVEAILAHKDMSLSDAKAKAIELLKVVGINEAERRFNGYPHQMSGGMRQRVTIAMALTCDPKLLILDEPTTALDVTIQAEIIDLLNRLRDEYDSGLSMLFISHNLAVVSQIADRVMVMYSGKIVEEGPTNEVLSNPRHPYTKGLLTSMPTYHHNLHCSRGDRLGTIGGTPPSADARPSGCAFRDRCSMAIDECAMRVPKREVFEQEDRTVRCIRVREV